MKKIIDVAKAASMLSKDSTKIGALVLSPDNRVIGVGCNGYPSGYDDTDLTNKYDKVIHAEVNALINSRAVRGEVHKIVIYGLPPCKDCMKFIAAYGVKEVHFAINKNIGSYCKWHKSYTEHKDLHPQLEFIEHDEF
jgi:dCMP deaminase